MINYIKLLLLLTVFSFGDFNYHLKPHQITSDIKCFFGLQKEPSVINGANVINTCYIQTQEGYVVIDSGPTYQYAQQAYSVMREENLLPIKYVINTSNNELNSLGNEFYQEQGAIVIGAKVETDEDKKIKLEKSISKEAFRNTRFVPLNMELDEDKTLTIGSTKIEIKKFEDKLVVYLPQKRTVFAGNFVSDRPSETKKEHSSTENWVKVFTKIEGLSWEHIVSSHGLKNNRYAIENTKEYLKFFQEEPKQAQRIIPTKDKAPKKKSQNKKVFIVKHIEKKSTIKKHIAKKSIVKKNIAKTTIVKKVLLKKHLVKKEKAKPVQSIHYTNLEMAKRLALKENKFVMIKIEADHCNPCKRLNKLLKTNDNIKKMVNQHIKAVRINRDHNSVPTDYDIRFAPTILLVQPKTNRVLVQLEGSEAFEDLEDALKVFVSDSSKVGLALR